MAAYILCALFVAMSVMVFGYEGNEVVEVGEIHVGDKAADGGEEDEEYVAPDSILKDPRTTKFKERKYRQWKRRHVQQFSTSKQEEHEELRLRGSLVDLQKTIKERSRNDVVPRVFSDACKTQDPLLHLLKENRKEEKGQNQIQDINSSSSEEEKTIQDHHQTDVHKLWKYKGFWSRTLPKFGVCTHGYEEMIGGHFMKAGYWEDCLHLPALALAAMEVNLIKARARAENSSWGISGGGGDSSSKKRHSTAAIDLAEFEVPVVVDVGANVGTCTLLLASQGIEVIAFEPQAKNFVALNASVHLNKFEDLVQLERAAVVSQSEAEQLLSGEDNEKKPRLEIKVNDPKNLGDSAVMMNRNGADAVDTQKKDQEGTSPAAAATILAPRVDTLDSVLQKELWQRAEHRSTYEAELSYHKDTKSFLPLQQTIQLLKMDCQGSELRALQGASALILEKKIDLIHLEFDVKMLARQQQQLQRQDRPTGEATAAPSLKGAVELLELLIQESGYHVYDLKAAWSVFASRGSGNNNTTASPMTLADFPHCLQYYGGELGKKASHHQKDYSAGARNEGGGMSSATFPPEVKPITNSIEAFTAVAKEALLDGAKDLLAISPYLLDDDFKCPERFLLKPETTTSASSNDEKFIKSDSLVDSRGNVKGVVLDEKTEVRMFRRFHFEPHN